MHTRPGELERRFPRQAVKKVHIDSKNHAVGKGKWTLKSKESMLAVRYSEVLSQGPLFARLYILVTFPEEDSLMTTDL